MCNYPMKSSKIFARGCVALEAKCRRWKPCWPMAANVATS